jgi:hypothetical protein
MNGSGITIPEEITSRCSLYLEFKCTFTATVRAWRDIFRLGDSDVTDVQWLRSGEFIFHACISIIE